MLPVVWKAEREAAALVLLSFRVLWLFCPQSAGGDVPQRVRNSFPSMLFQGVPPRAVEERGGSWKTLSGLFGAGLLESRGISVTIQWPALSLKFGEQFSTCFKGTGLHSPGCHTQRTQEAEWSGIPPWIGESPNDFYLYTALFLSPWLAASDFEKK